MILEGEIKNAKISSFSSDFQHSLNINFFCKFVYELLISLRRMDHSWPFESQVWLSSTFSQQH